MGRQYIRILLHYKLAYCVLQWDSNVFYKSSGKESTLHCHYGPPEPGQGTILMKNPIREMRELSFRKYQEGFCYSRENRLLDEYSLFNCNLDQLGCIAEFEFFQDVRLMPLDSLVADEEFFGDLAGGHAIGKGPDDFNFTRGDRLQVGPEIRFYLGKVMDNNVRTMFVKVGLSIMNGPDGVK